MTTGNEVLVRMLAEGKRTTTELAEALTEVDAECVDRLPQLLAQLQEEGIAERDFDRENGQFIWSLNEDFL